MSNFCRQGLNKHLYYPTQQKCIFQTHQRIQSIALECDEALQFPRGSKWPGLRDIPKPYKLEFTFLRIISINAWYSQEPTKNPLQDSVLLHPRDSVLWKIPLSSSRLRPATKACYSWWWQIKLWFYNTKWRTLPTILAPKGNLR